MDEPVAAAGEAPAAAGAAPEGAVAKTSEAPAASEVEIQKGAVHLLHTQCTERVSSPDLPAS